MKKIMTLFLLCISINTHNAQDRFIKTYRAIHGTAPSQAQLDAGIKRAVQDKDDQTVRRLLKMGAKPPVYTAAKTGSRKIAGKVAKAAAEKETVCLPGYRKNVLERLILTGDPVVMRKFFKRNIITDADIKPKHLKFAQKRARIHPPNKKILGMLTQACMKRKPPKKEEDSSKAAKEEKPECAICLEPIIVEKKEHRALACYDVFHDECIDPWLATSSSCPLCKRDAYKELKLPGQDDTQHHPRYFEPRGRPREAIWNRVARELATEFS